MLCSGSNHSPTISGVLQPQAFEVFALSFTKRYHFLTDFFAFADNAAISYDFFSSVNYNNYTLLKSDVK